MEGRDFFGRDAEAAAGDGSNICRRVLPPHPQVSPRQGRMTAVFQTFEARLLQRKKEGRRKHWTNVLFADRVGPN